MNFIQHLMRGGSHGHFWLKQSARTVWWEIPNTPTIPAAAEDIYFGVHPSRVSKSPRERTTIGDIEAINCLYSDFDLKDFEENKHLIASHLKELKPSPSVVIDSGGGYHCYWLLKEPFELDSQLKRDIASGIQRSWVIYVAGDLAVHDLARILRLPGTYNYKYDPPREVRIAYENLETTFTLEELQEYLPETINHSGEKKLPRPQVIRPNDLSEQDIVDLARGASNGKKFLRLFRGINSDFPSASEADLAFCEILAFWTGGDYEKIDRIFRASDRMRNKWDREDYRHETLTKAIIQASNFYIDPSGLLTAGANDEGNASCVYARIKDTVAFCEALGWLHYSNYHWESELATTTVENAIVDTLKARRKAAVEVDNENLLRATNPTASHVRNAQALLRRKVSVSVSEFDTSLDELNCQNGVLNLKTGKLTPHHYRKRFTYCLPVRYNPDADSTMWTNWLFNATGCKQDVVDFLQLALGYSLSGQVREEVMFYIHGPARAGKGVFTETLIAMLGGRPLATEVDIDMFMSKKFNSGGAGFSLASLKAARFVAASESRENEWLNAKRVKRWTGRNYITCAHKYGRDFTYLPQFKIWLTSNFPPQMDADDEAAWGRLRIVEFPISHLGKEDKMLKTKMTQRDNLEGVLAWIVQGAVKWYTLGSDGLQTPETVTKATRAARADVDWVAAWLSEVVTETGNENDRVPSDIYYTEYKEWCTENGVFPKSLRSLNRSIREAGYKVGVVTRIKNKSKRCWVGVKIAGYSLGLRQMEGKELR